MNGVEACNGETSKSKIEGHETQDHGITASNNQLEANESPDLALQKIRTAGSVSIPPELFEKLYLSPQNVVKGDLRKTFGNPTPLYVAYRLQLLMN